MKNSKETAELKCPNCGEMQEVEVPQNSCLAFYKCGGCEEIIEPKTSECCVVCSYSDEKCPVSSKD